MSYRQYMEVYCATKRERNQATWRKRRGESMHHYFHTEGKTDKAKMEEEARRRTHDKLSPEPCIVHDHPHGGRCSERCQIFAVPTTMTEAPGKTL